MRDREKTVHLTASLIERGIRANPRIVLGLATGRTMDAVYDELVEMHANKGLDFSEVVTFNLDEYIGLAADDKNSYRYYMNDRLFNRVNIDIRNTHLPSGTVLDVDGECDRYEEAIKTCGGIDMQLLGIGRSGHIGFNEPLSAMLSRVRPKALTPQTIEQNAQLFDDPSQMPRRAITMGVGTILESKRCLLLATGTEKAEVLARAVEGPITSMVSATALQLHPRCTVIVDENAAAGLDNREYYRWIFANEPEWQEFHRIAE